jgi:hypothetical protein
MCHQIVVKICTINFHANPAVGVQLFHADRRTDAQIDTPKLTIAFRTCFEKAPKNKSTGTLCIFLYMCTRVSLMLNFD